MMALTLSVPCADWLTPCEYIVTTRGVLANIWKKVGDILLGQTRRQRGRGRRCRRCCRARASASSKPLV